VESERNQLRFVNKQLFVETRSLELRYNDMDFILPEYASFFLQHCESAILGDLRILTIHHVKEWATDVTTKATMQPVLTFCKKFPKALVKARLTAISPNHPGSIYTICATEYAVRGTCTFIDMMLPEATREKKVAFCCNYLSKWKLYRSTQEIVNFRIFLRDETFDETKLEQKYEQAKTHPQECLYAAGNVEGMMKAMKHVIEHGI
jgi:hypothetical protein